MAKLETIIGSNRPESTQAIGQIIGQGLSVGDIVLLIGDLGSGKTCMTQGLIKGLGSEDIARSPTFSGVIPKTLWLFLKLFKKYRYLKSLNRV